MGSSRTIRSPLNGKAWPLLLPLGVFATLALWQWGWNIDVLDYGKPTQTYFDAASAAPGEQIHIHFDGVRWLRVCPSRLVQHVTCQQADPINAGKTITARLDLDSHVIDVPPVPGRVPPKARRFVVPPECKSGPLTFTAWAESTCKFLGAIDNTRYAYPPELHLDVK